MPERAESIYSVLMAKRLSSSCFTNISGVKLFLTFPETLPYGLFGEAATLTTGLITYPLTFLLTDIVCEVYGRARANLMIVTGFMMSLMSLAPIQIALVLPGAPAWTAVSPHFTVVPEKQHVFESEFTLPGVLVFASMTACLVTRLIDVRLVHFRNRVTGGRHLWTRDNVSTMTSQLVDTIIANSIFLGFGLGPARVAISVIIIASYLCKVVMALLDAPFTYLGVAVVR